MKLMTEKQCSTRLRIKKLIRLRLQTKAEEPKSVLWHLRTDPEPPHIVGTHKKHIPEKNTLEAFPDSRFNLEADVFIGLE